jgi:hypothetical protein
MIHGNAVANTNRIHLERHAAGTADSFMHGTRNGIKMHVSRDDVIVAVDDADEGSVPVSGGTSKRIEQ